MKAWTTLLKIKETSNKMGSGENSVFLDSSKTDQPSNEKLSSDQATISINFTENSEYTENSADIQIFSIKPFHCKVIYNKPFEDSFQKIFELYLPYALLNRFSRINQKPYVVSHFAQSLDGRIATVNGNSKWIGNQENLVHAHRMRALLDGILIGSGTIRKDNPQLTVRHVHGIDPCKIILGTDSFHNSGINALKGIHLQFSRSNNAFVGNDIETNTKLIKPEKILEKLFKHQILTIYLEGGSITTSCFLQAGLVDQVQVHLAPLIIGSGITGFNFPGINDINRAIKFKSYRYLPVGDQIMFAGEL